MQIQKIILLAVFLVLSQVAFSQTEKGKIQIGGNLGGGFTLLENSNSFSFTSAISTGYFLTDGFLIKENLGFSYSNQRVDTLRLNSQAGNIGVGLYYYFQTGKFQPFVGFQMDYYYSDNYILNTSNFLQANIDIGASYFLNEYVAVEFFIPFRLKRYIIDSSLFPRIDSSFNLNVGFKTYLK